MTAARIALSFVFAAALIAGCDDKKAETLKVDNGKPAIPNVDDIKKTAGAAKATADKAASDAKSASDTAACRLADTHTGRVRAARAWSRSRGRKLRPKAGPYAVRWHLLA